MLNRVLRLLLAASILLAAAASTSTARPQESPDHRPAGPAWPSSAGQASISPRIAGRLAAQAGGPDLSASEMTVAPTSVRAGDPLAYTVVLRNTGETDATADLSDPIPAGTTYVEGSATASSGEIVYSAATNALIWQGTIAPGVPVTLTFSVRVLPGTAANTPITNTATVDDHVNPPLALEATALVADAANLTGTTKAVDRSSALPGDILTYTVTLLNTGNRAALVSLSDPIPALTAYVPGSVVNGSYDSATNAIRWVGTLPATASRVITFCVRIDDFLSHGTAITNTASIVNVSPRIDRSAVTVITAGPWLDTSVKSAEPAAVASGDLITFTVTVTNTGPIEATASITDPVPLGTSFVIGSLAASGGSPVYDAASNRVLWTGPVPVGTQAWVRYAVQVTLPETATGAITNTAIIADGHHPPIERSASVAVPLLWLSCPGGSYYSGDTLDADLRISNVPGLQALQARISFSSSVLEVVGVSAGSWFTPSVWSTTWDNAGGTIDLSAALDSQPAGMSGSGVLATLHLRVRESGTSTLTITDSALSSAAPPLQVPIAHNRAHCQVTTGARMVSGSVILQGAEASPERYGGVQVLADGKLVATTDTDGTFSFASPSASFTVTLSLPGYLRAERRVTVGSETSVTLPPVTLLGGDVVGGNAVVSRGAGCPGGATVTIPGPPDGAIDLQDLTFVLSRFGMRSGDPGWGPDPCYIWHAAGDPRNFGLGHLADINRDGIIDIRDLAMVNINYRRSGLSPWP